MLARFHDEAKYFSSIQKTPAATSLCRYRGCSWDQRPEWFPLCQSFRFWPWKPLNKRAAPPNLHRHISIWLVHRIRDSVGETGAVKTRQEGGHWLAATESHSTNRPQSGDQASIPLVCKAGKYQIGCLFALFALPNYGDGDEISIGAVQSIFDYLTIIIRWKIKAGN